MPYPIPQDEERRLEALHRYQILDTPPDQALDDITRLAAHICAAPLALITFIDSHRQWFKSRVGFEMAETAREFAFCAHAIARPDEAMVVRDALSDPRFRDNPLVTGEPRIRFYYGLPLTTSDGHALGTLCVMDRVPRDLSAEETAALRALHRSVVSELELRRTAAELERATGILAELKTDLEARVEERSRDHARALESLRDEVAGRERANASLRESEERFRTLWETTTDAVIVLDTDSIIRYANPAVREVFDFPAADLVGRSLATLQPERLREAHRRGLQRFIATGQRRLDWRATETTGLRRGGAEFPVEIAFSTMEVGGQRQFVGFIRDITARKQAEERLVRLNRVYAMLSGINTLIVRTRDRQALLEGACRIAVEQGGFGAAWIGLHDAAAGTVRQVAWYGEGADEMGALDAQTAANVPAGRGAVGRAIRERKPVVIDDFLTEPEAGGKRRQLAIASGYRSKIALPLVVDGDTTGVLSILSVQAGFFNAEELALLSDLAADISFSLEVVRKEERLDYLAYYDALTGLPNRRLFQERLSRALDGATEDASLVGVLIMDVKNFRKVNETLGRAAGDALLCDVAERLKRAWPVPENVARMGGDAFAGFLTAVRDGPEIANFHQRTLDPILGAAFAPDSGEISLAVVAGIALSPGDGADAETLLKNAEAALKEAKRSGDRYLFYQPSMNATVALALRLESKLRRALAKEQFVLHYQPKVELATGKVTGFEALLRWQDPDDGLVPPGRVIPVLEETGMINEVGRWALGRASADFAAWSSAGLRPPRIAVNISAIQLMRPDFAEEIASLLRAAGDVGGGWLDLEITESLLLEDLEASIAKLRAIREMGVRIVIDDFGTGHSSLVYLAKLPVDALKVDQSFVSAANRDAQSMAIVSTIISLAHSLNLGVVAEGVESQAQADALRRLRCNEAQGYLFGRPAPANEVADLLHSARA